MAASQTINSIIEVPTLGGSMVSPVDLNQQGEVTGFSTLPGDMFQRPFLYSGGVMTDLGTLGGTQSRATALNGLGDVVGDSSTANDVATHAFLYTQGAMVDLGTLGGSFSTAVAVNDSGLVAGNSFISGNVASHGFLHDGTDLVDLGTLGGSSSTAVDINAAGDVVGDAYTGGDMEYHPFIYRNGTMIDLGTLGGFMALSYDINDAGQVVGESMTDTFETHAFLYMGGVMADLGTLGGVYSSASAINELGQVIGFSYLEGDMASHGFFHAGGVMIDLGTLGGTYSFANDINNLGQVVGDADDTDGMMRAFLWENGVMTDLNDLLPAGSGWDLWSALHINDAGQVMGLGLNQGNFAWFLLDLPSGNQPPVAAAGPDQDLQCAGAVVLDGSASQDPDGDALTYAWHYNGALVGQAATLFVSLGHGSHAFTLTVTDPDGATDQDEVVVTIADGQAPTVTCVLQRVVVADANCLALVPDVAGSAVATDNCDMPADLLRQQSPAAGTVVGLGELDVTVTVTDSAQNQSQCVTRLVVVDGSAPVIVEAPELVELVARADGQAELPDLTGAVQAVDNCSGAPARVQVPAPGTLLGVGDHTVRVTVVDAAGNAASHDLLVRVALPCQLVVHGASATPDVLAPANKVMVPVTITVDAESSCGEGVVTSRIVSVSSSQDATGKGDDTPVDWEVTGELTVNLRAELAAGTDQRVYTVTVECVDAGGNTGTATVDVVATRGNKNKTGQADGQQEAQSNKGKSK